MKHDVRLLVVLLFGVLFDAGTLSAQMNKPDLSLQVSGGLYSPLSDDIQNIYSTGAVGQVSIAASMGLQSRLKVTGNLFRKSGNPYISINDFSAGDAGKLSLNSVGMLLEIGGRGAHNPQVWLGAGLLYFWGSEAIDGLGKNRGDGLGAMFSLSPEFQISRKLFLITEASLRLVDIKFRDGNQRYTFNLSGATLSLGLGYQFIHKD